MLFYSDNLFEVPPSGGALLFTDGPPPEGGTPNGERYCVVVSPCAGNAWGAPLPLSAGSKPMSFLY